MFCKLMKLRKKSVVYLLYFQVSSKRPLSLFFFFFFPENFPISYLMLKSGKSFAKIGSRLQMAFFFLFYRNFQTPLPPLPLICLVLPNVPTPPPPKLSNATLWSNFISYVLKHLQNHKENILFPKNHYFERCTRPGYGRRVIVVARARTHHIKNTSTWNSHA